MANLNLNKVILGGRLTADPELRIISNNIPTTSFSIAVNGFGQKAKTSYFDLVAWRNNAEIITKYFKKGSNICVVGSLVNKSWTDKNGEKRYKVEIDVQEVIFVDSKSEIPADTSVNTVTPTVSNPEIEKVNVDESVDNDALTDDLPF